MDNQQTSDLTNEKFTWTIKNFSKLNTKKLYSETFIIGGYPWRILIFPNGNNVDYLSVYLDAADAGSLPHVWSRYATFSLAVINVNSTKTVKKDTIDSRILIYGFPETQHQFNATENDWGFTSFMPLREFRDPGNGYLVRDTCIINAEVSINKSGNGNQVDQAGQTEMKSPQQEDRGRDAKTVPPLSAQVCTEPIGHTDNPSLPKGVSSTPIGELMDFRGLGQIEKVFVPLLEEVCSHHPSLIECQQKRSRRFIEWAFTALGRVLHFLKTKTVKDMNDEGCKELQNLWEELETFKFDLTWLEPHIQSALGMKNYLERALKLKRQKENVVALEMEMERLEIKLAAAEVDFEIARRELVQAEEGFEERDMDAELGYGRP